MEQAGGSRGAGQFLPVLLLISSSMLAFQPIALEAAKAVLPNGQGEFWTTCTSLALTGANRSLIVVESAAQLQRSVRALQKQNPVDAAVYFVLSTTDVLYLDKPLFFDAVQEARTHCFVFGVKSNNTRSPVVPGKPLTLRCRRAKSAVIVKSPLVSMSRLSIEGCSDSGMKMLEGVYSLGFTTLQQLTFRNNSARNGGGLELGAGVLATLNNVQFIDNTAEKGGAVYAKSACLRVGAYQLSLKGCPNVSNCPSLSAFVGNKARQGGAVYVEDSACRSINQLLGSIASDDDSTFLLNGTRFDGNTADDGGAVFMDVVPAALGQTAGDKIKDIINVWDVVLSNNTAWQRGGALFITNAFSVAFKSANLTNNTAGLSGGAMWVSSDIFANLKLSSTQIQGNKVTYPLPLPSQATTAGPPSQLEPPQHGQALDLGGGGGVYAANTISVAIDSLADGVPSKFAHNSASHNGGAFACMLCVRVDIKDTSFESNSACSGGAVALDGLIAESSISNSRFTNNSASLITNCTEVKQPTAPSPAAANRTGRAGTGAKDAVQGPKCAACGAGGGGGLCSTSFIDITSSTFQSNRAAIGGGAYLMQEGCSAASCLSNISSCTFDDNNATLAGGAVFITSLQAALLPVPDSLHRQVAKSHGQLPPTWNAPPFTNVQGACKPAAQGSLLAPAYVALLTDKTTSAHTTGSANSTAAQVSPTRRSAPTTSNPTTKSLKQANKFSKNRVLDASGYGPSVATSAACLVPAGTQLNTAVVVANNQEFSLTFHSYDGFLQLIPQPLPGISFSMSSPNDLGLTQVSTAETVQDGAEIRVNQLSVNGAFGANKLMVTGIMYGMEVGVGEVEVNIRQCQVGEVTFGNLCRRCSSGGESEYSFNTSLATCAACPHNAACNGTTLVPRDSFWHASPRSHRIFHCPLVGACDHPPKPLPPGIAKAFNITKVPTRFELLRMQQQSLVSYLKLTQNQTHDYTQLQCSPGYKGNVCGSCTKHYGRKGPRCTRCNSQAASWVYTVLLKMAEGLFVFLMVLVRVLFRGGGQGVRQQVYQTAPKGGTQTVRRYGRFWRSRHAAASRTALHPLEELYQQQQMQQQMQQQGGGDSQGSRLQRLQRDAEASLSTLLEMTVIYVQVLGIIMSTQLPWSQTVVEFFSSLRFTEGTFVWLSPDCLLPAGSRHWVGYWRVGVIALTPGIVVVMVCGAWYVFTLLHPKSRFSYSLKHIITMVAIQAANFYYPSVLSTTLSIFTCTSLDPSGTSYAGVPSQASSRHGWWKQDYGVKCFTGRHTIFSLSFGVPLVLLLAIGIPCYVLGFLWMSNKRGWLKKPTYQEKFGHMYVDFEPKHYMWYGMRFALFLALSIAVHGLSYYGAQWQLLTLATVLSAFLWLHLWCQPYVSYVANAMYAFIIYGALATVYLSIPLSKDDTVTASRHWTTVMMVVVNCLVMVVLLLALLPGVLRFRRHLADFASSAATAINVITRRAGTYKTIIWGRNVGAPREDAV